MPPSAPRERFALLIRMHVGHSLNLLSNGGCWLNTLSIWGDTIEGHARLQPTLSTMRLGDGLVSATETTTVVTTSKIARNLLDNLLPLTGLAVAVIVNVAWIGFFKLLRLQACVDGCRRHVSPRAGRLWLRRPHTHQTLLRAKSRQRTSRHVPVPDAQSIQSVPRSKGHASSPTFHVLVF
jgi:hypothetical protein